MVNDSKPCFQSYLGCFAFLQFAMSHDALPHRHKIRAESLRKQVSLPRQFAVGWLGLCAALAGCGGPRVFDDPIAAMTDPRFTSREHMAAMEQARAAHPDDPRRVEQLKEIVSGPSHPIEFRAEAWRQLEDYNLEEAKAVLEYRLPTHPAWGFVEWASELIAQRGWVEMTPSLVRSLYRPSPLFEDETRPERLALQALHPGKDIREVVFDVVVTPPSNIVHAQWRLAAWELLNRLGEPDIWQERLAAVPSDADPMLTDLRRGYVELGVIARTREEVRWLQDLHKTEHEDWWNRCREVVGSLPAEHRRSLRLRHLAVLVRVADHHPEWLQHSAQTLLADLESRWSGRSHFHPDAILSASTLNTGPQSLREWGPKLSWADLLCVRLADAMIFEPVMLPALFPQAQRDREDTSTELGGVVDYVDGRPQAILYPPLQRSHDKKFYAPASMVEHGYRAPFHYHFHVQEVHNAEYAGPGGGDLEYANAMAINGLVFTSVGEGKLNADFYTEGRVVIDLGTLGRAVTNSKQAN